MFKTIMYINSCLFMFVYVCLQISRPRAVCSDQTRLLGYNAGGHTTPASAPNTAQARGRFDEASARRRSAARSGATARDRITNARAPEDASVTHGKMVAETRSKERHQAEPPARTAQCRALHRPSTQSPTATVHAPPLGADGGRPATQPHRRPL